VESIDHGKYKEKGPEGVCGKKHNMHHLEGGVEMGPTKKSKANQRRTIGIGYGGGIKKLKKVLGVSRYLKGTIQIRGSKKKTEGEAIAWKGISGNEKKAGERKMGGEKLIRRRRRTPT